MKKFFKWLGLTIAAIIVLVLLFLFYVNTSVNGRLSKTYDIKISGFNIPTDSASIERGHHRAALCEGCHGDNLGGRLFFDVPAIGKIYTPNLTTGKGGIGKDYTEEDWLRVISHGVKKNGNPVFIMPADALHNFGKTDLICLVSYLKSLKPIDNEQKGRDITLFGKFLVTIGAMGNIIPAETINNTTFNPDPVVEKSAKFGEYLVAMSACRVCHGQNLNGGKSPDPNAPPVPGITKSGKLTFYTDSTFRNVLRTGRTPDGKLLNPLFMPWTDFMKYNDMELSSVFAYLNTLN